MIVEIRPLLLWHKWIQQQKAADSKEQLGMRQPFLEQMSPAEMKLSLTDSNWLVKAKPPESSVEVSGAGDTPDASITDTAAVLGPVTSTTSTPMKTIEVLGQG
ncbi:hypothetical protein cgp_0105 [Corynebacterium glutamicum MB001]|uniref:Uncharacterized protein n=2 Tax=Corynebacterium glutamicum TaxID=1718 RepID=Q8NU63_CORGL|nr:hypothetical protein cgp_0105 [Corynebacterium glutamicum MB001]ARV65657.1 hypothetical protein B7P23_12550 [Corynebacterium glutamicum]CAF18645.1 hypothetical protein cg0105 [Corynebacterium glutamicum ATCC 13032]CCH23297.1 hypothetical protein WA5_0076 [Corynebacterium glutamicum K051]ASW12867.1 hypothetical protein cgc1_0105 [Corynebacterium glutamicum]